MFWVIFCMRKTTFILVSRKSFFYAFFLTASVLYVNFIVWLHSEVSEPSSICEFDGNVSAIYFEQE
jgi:hypothetical protein